MFLNYVIHYPKPEKEELLIDEWEARPRELHMLNSLVY